MDEPVGGSFVVAVCPLDDVLLAQRPTGGHEPLLPLAWGSGLVLGVQQVVPAPPAAALLGAQELQGVLGPAGGAACVAVRPSSGPGPDRRVRLARGPARDERSWS